MKGFYMFLYVVNGISLILSTNGRCSSHVWFLEGTPLKTNIQTKFLQEIDIRLSNKGLLTSLGLVKMDPFRIDHHEIAINFQNVGKCWENLQEIHRNPNTTIGGIFFPSIHHRIQPAPAMLRRWWGRVSTQRPNLALLTSYPLVN